MKKTLTNQEVYQSVLIFNGKLCFLAFQLIQRSFLPGRFKQWEHLIRQGWASRLRHSQPIGFWKTEFGPADNGIPLLHVKVSHAELYSV